MKRRLSWWIALGLGLAVVLGSLGCSKESSERTSKPTSPGARLPNR